MGYPRREEARSGRWRGGITDLMEVSGLTQPPPTDSIQAIYVVLGEALELPCPSPPALHGDEFLSWFRSPAAGSSTALVAHVQVARPSPDTGKPRRESRLKLLGNYSLWLEGSKAGDAGRYWCAVLGQRYRYQNWRVYDVSVLRGEWRACRPGAAGSQGSPGKELRSPSLPPGSQFSARAADGSSCSVLLCSVIPARSLESVTWQEGKGPAKGDVQSFWGDGATLLLVCPKEGLPEPRARKPGIIRCLAPQNNGISFSLAGKLSDNKGRDFCLQHIPHC